MDNVRNFEWHRLSWEEFQTFSIHFAQNNFPGCKFEEYLKKGNVQHGIDLKTFPANDGKIFAIQCKREKKLNLSDLIEIINEFETKPFAKITSTFVLATTADLQKPDLQKYLIDTSIRLQNDKQISFEYWDINFFEEQLKGYYSLAFYYFGKDAADKNCFRRLNLSEKFSNEPVPDFIPRRVFDTNIGGSAAHIGSYAFVQQTYSLKDIFEENRFLSKQVCIIADAYQGKSYYLRQTAYDLEKTDIPFRPLVIEIKSLPIQPIESLLNQLFGEWKIIPAKDLILFFDGMDEVPTDAFEEVIRHIHLFALAYPHISIVLSCRKLFYNRHRVKEILKSFNTYELYPLQYYDVLHYLKKKLGRQFDKFNNEISKAGIWSFLYHPFYLINLVRTFQTPPFRLPASKIQVLENFIENSFQKQSGRRVNRGQLHHNVLKYKKAIQKLAFALQLSGLNSFSDEQVQEIFDDTEIELLQYNSLISVNNGNWTFNNALFQEHLAALVLAQMKFDQILSHVTVGTRVKKIKSKWIQTISSLLSMLENSDVRLNKLLNFIEQDNIELIFTAEKTKFTSEFRLKVLKKLLTRCRNNQIRPMVIYEDTIASFIDHDVKATGWLVSQLAIKEDSLLIKITVLRIIRDLTSLEGNERKFFKIALDEINRSQDAYFIGTVFKTLGSHKLGSSQLVNKMVRHKLSSTHDFRDGLYELIMALNLVDEFYFFALLGYKALILHNKEITHAGSENRFERFLLSTNNPRNIKLLFVEMQEQEWLRYYESHSMQAHDFVREALLRAKQLYNIDNTIIFPIVGYVKTLGLKYLREDYYPEIDKFFDDTDSHDLAVRMVIDDILGGHDWELGSLIREDTYDYLLFELDIREFNVYVLRSCLSGLRHRRNHTVANKLLSVLVDFSEGKILEDDNNSYSEYQKFEDIKHLNDFKCLKNSENFRNGVINFFSAYGQNTIPENELYVDFKSRSDFRRQCDSNFVYHFLLRLVRSDKKAHLKDALKIIDDIMWFEYYRAKEILNYRIEEDREENKALMEILEQYYQTGMRNASFENCIWEEGNTYHYLKKEKLLGQIYERFAFKTDPNLLMDLVWVDDGGTKSFEHNTTNNKRSISQMILEQLSKDELEVFKKKIFQNIEMGIKSSGVLGNHIGLCKHLSIIEAKDMILSFIIQNKLGHLNSYDIIGIYLELGGDTHSLVNYFNTFNDYNSYTYIYLVSVLKEKHAKLVKNSLRKSLKSTITSPDSKLNVAAELSNLGDQEGFSMLMEYMKEHKRFPDLAYVSFDIKNLDTAFVLSRINEIMFVILDPAFQNFRSHDSVKNTVIDWLYGLASKTEEDMELVVNFIHEQQNVLKSKYSNTVDLYWYANTVVERFRDSDKTIKTIDQVKAILSSLVG